MRRALIVGNWKMNGSLVSNAALLAALKEGIGDGTMSEVRKAVCVPAPYLAQCAAELDGSDIYLGSQDISAHANGAFTGEVSGSMLLDFGCRFAIVGHSERRQYHGEKDELVARKAVAALHAGLTPIVCVGETLSERESDHTASVVTRQLETVLRAVSSFGIAKIVVAYEPVWAIGTGKTATPEMAQQVHEMLRQAVASVDATAAKTVEILYGGSMKPDNASALLAMPDIDGGLIGGAALTAKDFLSITRAAMS